MNRLKDLIDNVKLTWFNIKLLGFDYFVIKYRWSKLRVFLNSLPKLIIGTVKILSFLSLTSFLIFMLYSFEFSGFGEFTDLSGNYYRSKTLWDWLQLLVIPLFLAGVAFFLRRSEDLSRGKRDKEIIKDKAINDYLLRMQDILFNYCEEPNEKNDITSKISTALTHKLLREIDGKRKTHLLQLLYDAKLLIYPNPFINLVHADFTNVSFYATSLHEINLRGANLDYSEFNRTNINRARLSGTSLRYTNLSWSNFNKSNLEYALLDNADCYNSSFTNASLNKVRAPNANFSNSYLDNASFAAADLSNANFRKAKLRKAYLGRSKLVGTNFKNADLSGAILKEANLMYANLKNADLSGVDLTNAIVSMKQLDKAKSIDGAVLEGIIERLGPPQDLTKHKFEDDNQSI